jgi:hypothetical protein
MLLAQIVAEKELLYASRELIWDGQFAEAERLCSAARVSNPDSVVAAYVEGLAGFSRCFYTGESAMYVDALAKLGRVEDVLKRSWGEAVGDIFSFAYFRTVAIDWDRSVREALLAHALMLKAMVSFTTGSKFSGALAVRAAWKKFTALPAETHTVASSGATADDDATAGAKEIVRSMCQFGCGTFLMLLSYAPPALTSILRVMGFHADRERGTALLQACIDEAGTVSPDAAFSMLLKCMVEHKREEDVAVLSTASGAAAASAASAAGSAMGDAAALDPASWQGRAHTIADDLVAKYPRGSCCWLKSHLQRIQGDITSSLASMEGVERCATAAGLPRACQFRVLKEIAWCQVRPPHARFSLLSAVQYAICVCTVCRRYNARGIVGATRAGDLPPPHRARACAVAIFCAIAHSPPPSFSSNARPRSMLLLVHRYALVRCRRHVARRKRDERTLDALVGKHPLRVRRAAARIFTRRRRGR